MITVKKKSKNWKWRDLGRKLEMEIIRVKF